jgi:hypothetical protein
LALNFQMSSLWISPSGCFTGPNLFHLRPKSACCFPALFFLLMATLLPKT